MMAREPGLWVDPHPEAQNDKKMQSKKSSKPLIFRIPELNLTSRFCILGVSILKNSYNNSLKNVSIQAGSGLTCPHLHIRETFKSRKGVPASVAKNLRKLSHSLQVSTEGVLVLYHHRTLPVVSVSQYA
jgi:hypothetical protein